MARPGLPLLLTGAPAALVVGSALLLGLSGAGCRADPESRSVANEELGTVAVSDTLTLKVYPAAVATVTAAQVTLHASGARLALCASNTARQAAPLVVKLENLPPDLVLGCVAAQGSVCTVAGRLVEGEDGTGAVYNTEVPSGQSCPDGLAGPPTLVFRAANGAAAGPYTFAVAGDLLGDGDLVYRLVEEVSLTASEFLVLLGNLSAGEEPRDDLARVARILATLPIPVYATVGYEDISDGGDRVFRELFGPTDVAFLHKQVRFLLLDSADAVLVTTQFDWIAAQLGQEQAGSLLFTSTPPFDPAGLRDRGFVSHREASRLVAALLRGGVGALFAGRLLSYVETAYGGMSVYITGATGEESFDDIGPHFLLVTGDSQNPGNFQGSFFTWSR